MKLSQLDTYFLSCPLPQPVHTSTSIIIISRGSSIISLSILPGPAASPPGVRQR